MIKPKIKPRSKAANKLEIGFTLTSSEEGGDLFKLSASVLRKADV